MPPAVAAQKIGVVPCRGETCDDMLEAMARISPSHVLVLLAAGFALCFGESINLT